MTGFERRAHSTEILDKVSLAMFIPEEFSDQK
jgi:hypothetical protein